MADEYNQSVPGAPVAGASVALGENMQPTMAERIAASPGDPNSVTSVRYRPDGTVMPKSEEVDAADLGPGGSPAASPDDYPLAVDKIPSGWNRYPTPEEVAYLNDKLAPAQATPAPI